MKGAKKCKNNKANCINESQLESVHGGTGIPKGWTPADGARGKQIQPGILKGSKSVPGIMTLEERDDWAFYDGKNK